MIKIQKEKLNLNKEKPYQKNIFQNLIEKSNKNDFKSLKNPYKQYYFFFR